MQINNLRRKAPAIFIDKMFCTVVFDYSARNTNESSLIGYEFGNSLDCSAAGGHTALGLCSSVGVGACFLYMVSTSYKHHTTRQLSAVSFDQSCNS